MRRRRIRKPIMSGVDRGEAKVVEEGEEPEVNRAEEEHPGDSPHSEGEGVDGDFEDQNSEQVEGGLHRVPGGKSIRVVFTESFAGPIAAITIAKRVCSGRPSQHPGGEEGEERERHDALNGEEPAALVARDVLALPGEKAPPLVSADAALVDFVKAPSLIVG